MIPSVSGVGKFKSLWFNDCVFKLINVFNAIFRMLMAVILFVIEIALGMTGNQPSITQVMDKTSRENMNITADLVILAIMITSLLGHVMFRSYLQ